jgi:SAM-dependent methyltransferase
LHGTPGTFTVALCSTCDAGWTLPRVAAAELAAYYPPSYGFLVDSALQRRVQKLRLAYALSRTPLASLAQATPGRLLDVGCGRGDLAAALADRGWYAAGVDPSAEAVAFARGLGVDARVGTLESVAFDDESFDAVVMHHSLEHVPDALAELARIKRLLRPGGLLVISLPNFDSWERRRFGSAWFHLDLPRHRTHFGPKSLRLSLEKSGFDVVKIDTAGDPGSFLASVQYRLAGRLFSKSVPALWAQYGLGMIAAPVRAVLDRRPGGGPVLHTVARRPA